MRKVIQSLLVLLMVTSTFQIVSAEEETGLIDEIEETEEVETEEEAVEKEAIEPEINESEEKTVKFEKEEPVELTKPEEQTTEIVEDKPLNASKNATTEEAKTEETKKDNNEDSKEDEEEEVIPEGFVVDGKKVHYYRKGKELFGLITDEGKWYFINKNNKLAKGWKKTDNKWYYFNNDGVGVGGWIKWEDKWYYCDKKTGVMKTGWLKDNDKWYLLNGGDSGRMLTGWQKVDGKWYYMATSGAMYANRWLKWNNKWYYLGSSGAMVTGWKVVNHAWYYMKANGAMVTGTQTIDGKSQTFDGYGRWIKNDYARKVLNKVGWNLKSAYNWSVKNITYKTNTTDASYGIKYFANYGFQNLEGNCYSYAGTVYMMAKMLGYDVRQVSGQIKNASGGTNAHSWLEIYEDGKTYVLDPDFEYEVKKSGYYLEYDQAGWVKPVSSKYMKE